VITSAVVLAGALGTLVIAGPTEPRATRAGERPSSGWDLELAAPAEPGRPLVLQGTARRSARGDSLPGFVFFVYQADARGRYGPLGPDADKPRLAGFVKTGPRGEFRIRTILPGTYGGPPHLHFDFRDSLGAMRTTFLNMFPPTQGDYAAYGPEFPRNFRGPRPGLMRRWVSGSLGRLLITQPADLEVFPDSSGVFRVQWDLDVGLSAPNPDHPGWGPEVPR
jgi:hypothetical protein